MNYNEVLNCVTVRINVKDEETGSGIIYKSSSSDLLYIFTAKHCIYGQDFDNGAKPKHIRIDKIKAAKKDEDYRLQKVTELLETITMILLLWLLMQKIPQLQ